MPPVTRSKAVEAGLSLNEPPVSPNGLRNAPAYNDDASIADSDDSFDTVPPVYTIDLSLPPAQRYVHVAKDYKAVIDALQSLFDELLDDAKLPRKLFHFIARLVLRRLYSKEQTEEIRGISKVVEVPMYLMVAYNVLLDLFMGCTSGGVMVKEQRDKKMMHFRTLDWSMPVLRRAIVQYEFKEKPDGEVVARSISYVGFVGVLTGVRQGLSVSLNFRPYHDNDQSKLNNLKFYGQHFLVLLGIRPSICAHLRSLVLPTPKKRKGKPKDKEKEDDLPSNVPSQTLSEISQDFPSVSTTAAYLIFCDGTQTLVLEKDRITAKPITSTSFITVTNHDTSYEQLTSDSAQTAHTAHATTSKFGVGMKDIVDESIKRKECLAAKWEKRRKKLVSQGRAPAVLIEELKEWLLDYPVTNDETHVVTIMDPTEGSFKWVKHFEDPAWVYSDEEDGEGPREEVLEQQRRWDGKLVTDSRSDLAVPTPQVGLPRISEA